VADSLTTTVPDFQIYRVIEGIMNANEATRVFGWRVYGLRVLASSMVCLAWGNFDLGQPARKNFPHRTGLAYAAAAFMLIAGAALEWRRIAAWGAAAQRAPHTPGQPPTQEFWAYATGVGHVAAVVAILTGMQARLAAVLLTAMFASFTPLVHLPILVANRSR
jgi:hypothetical protein